MKSTSKWIPLLLVCSATLFGSNCTADLRDAAIWGALNYVTAQTNNVLYWLFPAPAPRTR